MLTAEFCYESPETAATFPRNAGIRRYFAANHQELSAADVLYRRKIFGQKFGPDISICLPLAQKMVWANSTITEYYYYYFKFTDRFCIITHLF